MVIALKWGNAPLTIKFTQQEYIRFFTSQPVATMMAAVRLTWILTAVYEVQKKMFEWRLQEPLRASKK
jgi:hypothetical protein